MFRVSRPLRSGVGLAGAAARIEEAALELRSIPYCQQNRARLAC
jgi:hypothetical protein